MIMLRARSAIQIPLATENVVLSTCWQAFAPQPPAEILKNL